MGTVAVETAPEGVAAVSECFPVTEMTLVAGMVWVSVEVDRDEAG
jgi:hypothetical protein